MKHVILSFSLCFPIPIAKSRERRLIIVALLLCNRPSNLLSLKSQASFVCVSIDEWLANASRILNSYWPQLFVVSVRLHLNCVLCLSISYRQSVTIKGIENQL